MEHYDVIVIGVVSMGAAACNELTEGGVRVLGLDKFALGAAVVDQPDGLRLVRTWLLAGAVGAVVRGTSTVYIEQTYDNEQIYGLPMTNGPEGGFKLLLNPRSPALQSPRDTGMIWTPRSQARHP